MSSKIFTYSKHFFYLAIYGTVYSTTHCEKAKIQYLPFLCAGLSFSTRHRFYAARAQDKKYFIEWKLIC